MFMVGTVRVSSGRVPVDREVCLAVGFSTTIPSPTPFSPEWEWEWEWEWASGAPLAADTAK